MKQIELTNYLNNKYPEVLASSFDMGKIGLQFGSNNKEIKKVMIALDGTFDVVNEAIEKNVDLLITHHPFLFNPILSVNYDSIQGRKLINVFSNKLNVYSMHTNFDTAKDGMNEILARILGLKEIHAEKEELDNSCFIRMGYVDTILLNDFAKQVIEKLGEEGARIIGKPNKKISKVGIVGGAGASEIKIALKNNCDCLITGEVKHNQAIDAKEAGLTIVEVSHSIESLFKNELKKELNKGFPGLEVVISEKDINPFSVIAL